MIRSLSLRQWRAYDALDLRLEAGTTFVVAANGIGKTSLLLGMAWAVFGEHSNIDARSCIRSGATGAEATVELTLPDDRTLKIHRSIGSRGPAKTAGLLNDKPLDGAAVEKLLEQTYGVQLDVAARLALMAGGGQLAARDALNLKSHLYKAFGIAELLSTAELARKIAKEAEKQRGATRVTAETQALDRDALAADIAATNSKLAEAKERLRQQEQVLRQAGEVLREAERFTVTKEQLRRYEQEVSTLADEARDVVAPFGVERGVQLTALLEKAAEEFRTDADSAAASVAAARARIAGAEEAVRLLSLHLAQCPTCRQKLTASQLSTARAEHEQRLEEARAAVAEHGRVEVEARARGTHVASLRARLEALRPPSLPSTGDEPPDTNAALEAQRAAMEVVQQCNREIGALEGNVRSGEARLVEDTRAAESEKELRVAYRREALSLATATAFETAAREVISKLIEPIAAEVRARWQQLFPLEGLTLRPDGTVVRILGNHTLEWDTLSGGERVWARIVTHLLVLASATRLPFVWFDEPLEHLDPQLRRVVAATLATTTRHGYPRQLLVTTYEDAIARQLAEDTGTARIVAVRAAGPVPRLPNRPPQREASRNSRARRAS